MRPIDIEQKVFDLEQVRIVIRAPVSTELGDYSFTRMASGEYTVESWVNSRLKPILMGHEVVIIGVSGALPTRLMTMDKLRNSYNT